MDKLPHIVHLDADAFFVSVELALHPELRGKKVAVGGMTRGIISSASYEARAAGVYTPMPTARALKICPDLIMLPHEGSYSETSRKMFQICETLSPIIERTSIDEGYMDIRPCNLKNLNDIRQAVRNLQKEIWCQLQIPVSFGIASNRLISQVASKLRKPNGFILVPPGEEAAFLAPLPIGRIPGIGPQTEERLNRLGFKLICDIQSLPDKTGKKLFSENWPAIYNFAHGIDDRPVYTEHDEAKSYSRQHTFPHDIDSTAEIERTIKQMIDLLMPKIRIDQKRARTISLRIRYPDFNERSISRTLRIASDIEDPFFPLVSSMLKQIWTLNKPLRLVAVSFSNFESANNCLQLDIFSSQNDERRRRLAQAVDRLNRKTDAKVFRGHQL